VDGVIPQRALKGQLKADLNKFWNVSTGQ